MGSRIVRGLLIVFLAYLGVMALMTLQYLFDRGDLKKATQVLYEFVPPQKKQTLIQLIAENLAVKIEEVSCESTLISRYEGRVALECGRNGTHVKDYVFEIDVVGSSVKAISAKAKEVTLP